VCYSLTFQLQIHLLLATTKEQGAHTHYGKRTQGVYTLGLNGVVKNGLLNLHWRSIFFSLLASNFVVLLCTSFRDSSQKRPAFSFQVSKIK
jgi:hypothetical protein